METLIYIDAIVASLIAVAWLLDHHDECGE
jgi:hypothetical protein